MERDDILIQKYIRNELNSHELEELSQRLEEDPGFKAEFQAEVKQEFLIDQWRLKESRDEKLDRTVASDLFRESKGKRVLPTWFKYAAALVVVLLSGYLVKNLMMGSEETEQAITLILSDGSSLTIQEDSDELIGQTGKEQQVKLEENTLVYDQASQEQADENSYNEIRVPVGKRIKIRLSDGTLVFMNSDSRFRYPVSFSGQQIREVFLTGEGYFEVAEDSLHPFVVHADSKLSVKVLGTHFNVRAYPEDSEIKTSLAEGKVEVAMENSTNQTVVLVPGEAASWTVQDNQLKVMPVNLDNEMGWIRNKLLFVDEPFADVVRKIERSYGVQIENKLEGLDTIRFNGDFDIQNESVEDVLSAFSMTGYFNYSINKHKITLKR